MAGARPPPLYRCLNFGPLLTRWGAKGQWLALFALEKIAKPGLIMAMGDGNFYQTLKTAFAGHTGAVMLSSPEGAAITYGRMDARSAQMAAVFHKAGARPGDRILVQVDKSIDNVAAYLGAMRAGLVYVPLNTAYRDAEVDYFLTDAEPSLVVCAPDREAALAPLARSAGAGAIFTLDNRGTGSLCLAADAATPEDVIQQRSGEDPGAILYTSGTTGRSKGAVLSHDALRENARALNALWGFSHDDILVHALPIFHIHGLFVALHTAMLSACEIVFLPRFDVAALRSAMHRASVVMGVPTFYTRLLGEPDFPGEEIRHIRLFISGSAPLAAETFEAFEQRTGHSILERYGMSEAGMIASNPLNGERIAGTVGFALPGVDLRIVSEAGGPCAAGAPGEVEIAGPHLFSGYWRQADKTEKAFRDGWFGTGDIGALDETGRLSLSGRASDMIIAGGYNIYPKEIEIALDAIDGVVESAIIGAPHNDLGEGVVGVLATGDSPAPPSATIESALADLAKFKRPRRFYCVDALPRNAMGKVQKNILRERYGDAFSAPSS